MAGTPTPPSSDSSEDENEPAKDKSDDVAIVPASKLEFRRVVELYV